MDIYGYCPVLSRSFHSKFAVFSLKRVVFWTSATLHAQILVDICNNVRREPRHALQCPVARPNIGPCW